MKVKVAAMVALILLLAPAAFAEHGDVERPQAVPQLSIGFYAEDETGTEQETEVMREVEGERLASEAGAPVAGIDRARLEEN